MKAALQTAVGSVTLQTQVVRARKVITDMKRINIKDSTLGHTNAFV